MKKRGVRCAERLNTLTGGNGFYQKVQEFRITHKSHKISFSYRIDMVAASFITCGNFFIAVILL